MNRRDVLKSSLLGASAFVVSPTLAQESGSPPTSQPHPAIWAPTPAELNGGRMPNIL